MWEVGEGEKGEGAGVIKIIIPKKEGKRIPVEIIASLPRQQEDYPYIQNLAETFVDFKVFQRYLRTMYITHQIIYTQDDDCVVQIPSNVMRAYEPGVVTCNMPQHRRAEYADGVALVGWGAIFDRNLTSVFNLYLRHFPIDDLFLTECDRVFTGLNRVKMIDVPFVNLENAEGADRLHKRPDHWEKLREIRERIKFVKQKEGIA